MGAGTKPPGAARVVIDPGSHDVLNLGDVAMLEVAVERVLQLWPGARIGVLTTAPDALARHCPAAEPVPARGRYGWVADPSAGGLAQRAVLRAARSARAAGPAAARLGVGAERAIRGLDDDVRQYLAALSRADLFLVAGRGGMCDAFADESHAILAEVETAGRLGVPSAMVGQGVGPLEEPALLRRASTILPGVRLIAVREGDVAPRLLGRLGVPSSRVVVTGDDAIEPAWRARPRERAATGIGLSLRMAPYAEVDEQAIEAVGRAVSAAAERHGSDVLSVPVSLYPHEADAETIARSLGRSGREEPVTTTAEAIARAGRCRVVVAGSYHGAVFAAAQGVPTVALAGSEYYRLKMEGLRAQFGSGVRLLRLGERDLEDSLRDAIDRAWDATEADRGAMLEAAERQVSAGRDAYRALTLTRAGGRRAA